VNGLDGWQNDWKTRRKQMKFNVECLRPRLGVLVIVTSLLSACATVGFEGFVGVCPPVVEYDAELQAKAAEELQLLSEGMAVVEMMGDYAVMREQARVCSVYPPTPLSSPSSSALEIGIVDMLL
jgi:hypothetical protein